jgi:hypothetical protein
VSHLGASRATLDALARTETTAAARALLATLAPAGTVAIAA